VNLFLESPYAEELRSLGVELWGSGEIPGVEKFLIDQGPRFDAVILSRIEVAERHHAAVRRHSPDALVLFDTVDLHFLRQDREVELRGEVTGGFDPATTRRAELAAMGACDVTVVCSTAEQDLLAELVPDSRVVVVPTLQDDVRSSAPLDERDSVLFVGGFEHPPNADGLKWFIDEIFPNVLELVPDAKLDIIGSAMPVEVRQMAGGDIRVHGHVPDLTEFYDRARVAIAPIRFGAGVKGKVTQALARGVPCVATTIGAEGSRADGGEHLLIADDPEGFAAEIARLYHDDELWQRIASAGRMHSDRHYGIEAAQRELVGLFPDLIGPPAGLK
jgi:glycosyltransferase involved in cell wall biosynthesis